MYTVAIYVTRVIATATMASLIPLVRLLCENVQHIPETPTKITRNSGCINVQNQPASRKPKSINAEFILDVPCKVHQNHHKYRKTP